MLLLGDHELLVLLHLLALLVRARPHRLARILHLLWAQHAGQEVVGVQRRWVEGSYYLDIMYYEVNTAGTFPYFV